MKLLIQFTHIDGVRRMRAVMPTFGYAIAPQFADQIQQYAEIAGLKTYGEFTLTCKELADDKSAFFTSDGKDYVLISDYTTPAIGALTINWLYVAGIHHYADEIATWVLPNEDEEDGEFFAVTPAEIRTNGLPPAAKKIQLKFD
jgi:hypothetical protein